MNILLESFKDIRADLGEYIFLYKDYLKKLELFRKQLLKNKTFISSSILANIHIDIGHFENEINKHIKDIKNVQETKGSLSFKLKKKEKYYQQLRSIIGMIGNLITSTDYQSPSISHTLQSQAGIQTGMIKQSSFDYKRDQHWNEKKYESAFIKEYIFNFVKYSIFSYTTSSGMAALTSIIVFLKLYKKINGTIMLGKSSYFETKILIHALYKDIIEFDEDNADEIKILIQKYKPDAIFIDSLSNSYDLKKPNIEQLIKNCKELKKDIYVILDNTSLSIACQPFKYILGKTKTVHLIVWESLNKFHQFGLDRITGGIIYGSGKDVSEIFYGREHAGTNIQDTSIAILPTPHKKTLQERLKRLHRNAEYLYDHLKDSIDIRYVSESPYLILHLPKEHQQVSVYQKLISTIMSKAREQNIQLIHGTSFGLNTTRVYLTAINDEKGKPFIRISPGTETMMEIEKIAEVINDVIKKLRN